VPAWFLSGGGRTDPNTSMRRMSGRCRRAGSTKTKIRTRRRCASCTRKPASARFRKLGEIADWLTYDLPREVVKTAWGGRYRGQKQKWYALRFTGKDGEINIDEPGGHKPEFVEWKWVAIRELPDLVIPFKRQTYERVVKEFERFARQT
jgi:hypothetical protein